MMSKEDFYFGVAVICLLISIPILGELEIPNMEFLYLFAAIVSLIIILKRVMRIFYHFIKDMNKMIKDQLKEGE